MKKLIISLLGIVAVCSVMAQENPKNILGLRVGYAASWATTYGVKSSVQHGYSVGVSEQVLLSQKVPFYFETGLGFIAKGYKIQGFDDSSTTLNYLQLPIGVNYHIRTGKHVTIEPAAGFYYALGLFGNRKYNGEKTAVFTDESTSRHDLGYNCGIGASIHRFFIGISYESSLLNIDKADKVYGEDSSMLGYKKLKNNSVIIKVGVNF